MKPYKTVRSMSELERFSTVLYGFLRFLSISYVCFFSIRDVYEYGNRGIY